MTTAHTVLVKFHFSLAYFLFRLSLGYTLNTYLPPGFKSEILTKVWVMLYWPGWYFSSLHVPLQCLPSQKLHLMSYLKLSSLNCCSGSCQVILTDVPSDSHFNLRLTWMRPANVNELYIYIYSAHKRNVLRRQSRDTNRNIKTLVFCQYG